LPDEQLPAAITSLLNRGQAIDWSAVMERADALHMMGPFERTVRGIRIEGLALSQDQRDVIRILALQLQRMRTVRRIQRPQFPGWMSCAIM